MRNITLLGASLFFYLFGGSGYILLLLFSITANYFAAKWIHVCKERWRRTSLGLGLAINLVPLFIFKYMDFGTGCLNELIHAFGLSYQLVLPHVFLPAGVSFFTFQGLAYIIDVYRKEIVPCDSLLDFALFKSFFPQLVAGPIVRYQRLADQLKSRKHSLANAQEGLTRFGFGLSKKLLLADTLGKVADNIFAQPIASLETPVAWIGIACYTLQIFYDFSGYSDMAIGIGLIFGLSLPENFDQPYAATSVTNFWTRWHMSLTTWFRDYVYIPLGGNRMGVARTLLNLVLVFALCGLWHGAATTFIVWGLFHGFILLLERLLKHRFQIIPKGILGWLYTMTAVMCGLAIFRSPDLRYALQFLGRMAGGQHAAETIFGPMYYLTNNVIFIGCISILLAASPRHCTAKYWFHNKYLSIRPFVAVALTTLAIIAQAPQSFNPFIYFRF